MDFLNFFVPRYLFESFELVSTFLEILLWIAIIIIFVILARYGLEKQPWKKAYRMTHDSMILTPLLYTVTFFTLRIYLSIPIIIGLFFLFAYVEKSELAKIAKKFHITDPTSLKKCNQPFIIMLTLSMIAISLLTLHTQGIAYTF